MEGFFVEVGAIAVVELFVAFALLTKGAGDASATSSSFSLSLVS